MVEEIPGVTDTFAVIEDEIAVVTDSMREAVGNVDAGQASSDD